MVLFCCHPIRRCSKTLPAIPTDENGVALPPGHPPPPRKPADAEPTNPYHPFNDRYAFEFADYHFTELQSSESQIDRALDQWRAERVRCGGSPNSIPWSKTKDLLHTIDSIKDGPAPWKSSAFTWTGPRPKGQTPKWMVTKYELVLRDGDRLLRDQIALPELDGHFDYTPYIEYDQDGQRVWSNLLSGTWSYDEAVSSTCCLLILGSFIVCSPR
jgi:hypothetical protein